MDLAGKPPPRKRRRPALACEECRQRKVKCDQKSPCGQCELHKHRGRQCIYKKDSRVPPTVTYENQLAYPVSLPSPPGDGAPLRDSALPPPLSQTGTPPFSRGQSPRSSSNVQMLADRVQRLEAKLSRKADSTSISPSATTTSSAAATENNAQVLPAKGAFSKSRYFGQSHWANGVDQLGLINTLRKNIKKDKNSDINRLLHECKNLGRIAKAQYPVYQPVVQDFRNLVPSRDVCDRLVQNYFTTLESVYRVLHVPSFYEEYRQYWHGPQSTNTPFVMKLLLVMAIGTCFYRNPSDAVALRASAPDWIYAIQSWMSSPFEKSRVNLTVVQIHCLLLLARQTCAVSGDLVWISAGSLLRTAMHVGLHRDPHRLPKMTVLQAEVRRRLWATVLELQVQSSVDSGGPPMISLKDCDCEPPSNLDDADLTDEDINETITIPNPMSVFTQTTTQILLLNSLPIRLKIAKTINGLRSHFSYDKTLKLHEELNTSLRSNALSLQSFHSGCAQPTNFQMDVVDLLTHRFVLTLHYPFAMKARTEPTYFFSRKTCVEKALLLLSSPNPQNVEPNGPSIQHNDFASLKLYGSGHYRGVMVLSVMMLCGEMTRQLEEDPSPLFLTESASLQRKEIYKSIESFAELSASRVKAGETNVKGYAFSACFVAQLNALLAGMPAEPAVLEAARDSLLNSYQWLKARTEGNTAGAPAKSDDAVVERPITSQVQHNYPDDDDIEDGFGWEEFMQDSRLNFDIPDNWLFSPLVTQ